MRLVLRSMPEETTRAAALKKGEIDIGYLFTGPVAEDIRRTPGFKLVAPKESPAIFWVDLPDQWDPKSPWHDRRVRLAASHALDREALAGYLQNVGILTKIRTMERASMTAAWRDRKLKNVIIGITGAGGNAATRLEAYVSKGGIYTSGVMPDVEDLFQRQARETDVKKREALIHQIQQILRDRVTHVPIYELAFIWGVGPRVDEPGINLDRKRVG